MRFPVFGYFTIIARTGDVPEEKKLSDGGNYA